MEPVLVRLAKQRGGHGYFAQISLTAQTDEVTGDLVIEFDSAITPQWRPAVLFGIQYAWRVVRGMKAGRVKVESLEWNPADTTPLLVAYVAAIATADALGEGDAARRARFDVETGSVTFPVR